MPFLRAGRAEEVQRGSSRTDSSRSVADGWQKLGEAYGVRITGAFRNRDVRAGLA